MAWWQPKTYSESSTAPLGGGLEGHISQMVSDACNTGLSVCSKTLSFLSFGIGSDEPPSQADRKHEGARSVVFVSPAPQNEVFSQEVSTIPEDVLNIAKTAMKDINLQANKASLSADGCNFNDVQVQQTPLCGIIAANALKKSEPQLAVA